jgi:predicted dehydrogenase
MVGADAPRVPPELIVTGLTQAWPRPARPRPIVIIGAGAIVRSAHLPAYARLAYPIAGFYDIERERARATADTVPGAVAFPTLAAARQQAGAVFDLAVPGDQIVGILRQLPEGAAVLIQKPMGSDLAEARRILDCCTARRLTATMNFQLRFSPNVLALRDLIARGLVGTLVDVDVRVVIDQPWHMWTFLEGAPRVEVLYHSIHYIDAIRWIAGEPRAVYCRGVGHPSTPKLHDTRSTIILDYGDRLRCSLVLNHTHRAGAQHQASQMMVEGLDGAARLTWGVNLAYPSGPMDTMEVACGGEWTNIPLRGSWFTEAFEGPMSNLQRFAAGEDATLVGSVHDAIRTMAIVEACYTSSASGGTPIPG